jgi:histidinol-phosphate/aromatic aminotransferase/cobyric acid decarboxylase-like protein
MGMPDGLRVTVGTSDENEKFLTAYAKIVNAHKSS